MMENNKQDIPKDNIPFSGTNQKVDHSGDIAESGCNSPVLCYPENFFERIEMCRLCNRVI